MCKDCEEQSFNKYVQNHHSKSRRHSPGICQPFGMVQFHAELFKWYVINHTPHSVLYIFIDRKTIIFSSKAQYNGELLLYIFEITLMNVLKWHVMCIKY